MPGLDHPPICSASSSSAERTVGRLPAGSPAATGTVQQTEPIATSQVNLLIIGSCIDLEGNLAYNFAGFHALRSGSAVKVPPNYFIR
jgi:hypothetical protein